MTVTHRPPRELLLDYAAGNLAEPLALLVATHLTLCPESRREVSELEALGGALLETAEPESLSPDSLDRVLARLDEQKPEAETAAAPPAPRAEPGDTAGPSRVPGPLRRYLGDGLDGTDWRRLGPSIAEAKLLGDRPAFKTRLLRIRAGAAVPLHTHEGSEYTLVLEGGFSDELGHYLRGDVSVTDSEVTHRPVADDDEDCICLVVTDAPLRLAGPFGRLLNRFVRF